MLLVEFLIIVNILLLRVIFAFTMFWFEQRLRSSHEVYFVYKMTKSEKHFKIVSKISIFFFKPFLEETGFNSAILG